jgi:hypothetical protein
VRHSLQRVDHRLVLGDTKTPESRATIRLPQVAIAALSAHRARQEKEKESAGSRWQESGYVFTTRLGCVCQLDLAHFDTLIWPPLGAKGSPPSVPLLVATAGAEPCAASFCGAGRSVGRGYQQRAIRISSADSLPAEPCL